MKRKYYLSAIALWLFTYSSLVAFGSVPHVNDISTLVLYHMDEGSGTAIADASSYGRDAILNTDLASQSGEWVAGQAGFGNAVHFDQVVSANPMIVWDDPGDSMLILSTSSFTVEAQINPDGFVNEEYIFSIGSGLGSTVSLRWTPSLAGNQTSLNGVTVGVGNTDVATITLSDQLVAGQWQNLALVYTETGATSTFEIYRDGNLSGSAAWGSQIGPNPTELQIGHTPGNIWYRSYRGAVDEFRISDVNRYASPLLDPNTVAIYRFDTMYDDDDAAQGEYVRDDSGHGWHLKRSTPSGNFGLSQDAPPLAPSGSLVLESIAGAGNTDSTDAFSIGRTGELTVEFWYLPTAGTTINYILTQVDPTVHLSSWGIYQGVPSGGKWALTLGIFTDAGAFSSLSTPIIFDDTMGWTHIALTIRSSGTATFFKDGIAIASQGGFGMAVSKSYPLRTSADSAGNFAGTYSIDDLRISGKALNPGTGSGVGELAWNTSLSMAPTKGIRPCDVGKQWLRRHPFMLNSWFGSGGSDPADWSKYTDANFNSTFSNRTTFQTTIAAGVTSHNYGGIFELDGEAIKTIEIASHVSNMEAWMIGDEIAPNDIAGGGDVADYIRSIDPDRIIYAGLGSSGEAYIDNVINTIKPDAVIHGWYFFANPAVLPLIDFPDGHYRELEVMRRKSLEHGVDMFYYIQSFADHLQDSTPYRWLPSESELRFDLFTKLAFGVKGFLYFGFDLTQVGSLSDDALYDSGSNTTSALYGPATLANAEVLNLGNALRFLESTDIRYLPGQIANPTPTALTNWSSGAGGDIHIQDISVVEQAADKDGFIGFFEDDDAQQYFMLVNTYKGQGLSSAATTLNFEIEFDSSVTTIWRLRRDTGAVEAVAVPEVLGVRTLSLALPGGTGDLFKYDNANFATSGCADLAHPYPIGDMTCDCRVDLDDFSILSSRWFDTTCINTNWCDGSDLDMSGSVTVDDFGVFAENWLDDSN